MSDPKRIVIAGGSGFIGSALAAEFSRLGHEVHILTRQPRGRSDRVRELVWDGQHPGEWLGCLNGAGVLINLTGKNINCPHTPGNLAEIAASRVNSVTALATALGHLKTPPPVWIQASAVGFYGDTADRLTDETTPNGAGTLADICFKWEDAFNQLKLPGTRKVTLRIGFVLGREGGALPVLASLARVFLGGAAGNGRQYISWVHLADLVRMFVSAVESESIYGPFNAVAPNPVTNATFMRELRRVYRRPWSPPAPAFAVRLGARLMGGEGSLALTSQRCVPKKFEAAGFKFQFPELPAAFRDLCQAKP